MENSSGINSPPLATFTNPYLNIKNEITVNLLKSSMENKGWEGKKFLIDGYPSNKDNFDGWLKIMKNKVNFLFVLHLDYSYVIIFLIFLY